MTLTLLLLPFFYPAQLSLSNCFVGLRACVLRCVCSTLPFLSSSFFWGVLLFSSSSSPSHFYAYVTHVMYETRPSHTYSLSLSFLLSSCQIAYSWNSVQLCVRKQPKHGEKIVEDHGTRVLSFFLFFLSSDNVMWGRSRKRVIRGLTPRVFLFFFCFVIVIVCLDSLYTTPFGHGARPNTTSEMNYNFRFSNSIQ